MARKRNDRAARGKTAGGRAGNPAGAAAADKEAEAASAAKTAKPGAGRTGPTSASEAAGAAGTPGRSSASTQTHHAETASGSRPERQGIARAAIPAANGASAATAAPAARTASSGGEGKAGGEPARRPAQAGGGATDAARPAAERTADRAAARAASAAGSPQAAPKSPAANPPSSSPAASDQAAPKAAPRAADEGSNPFALAELPARLAENIERIETLGQRLLFAMAAKPVRSPGVEGPGPELYGSVAQAWLKLATEQPARLIEQQVRFWGQTLRHVAAAQGAFARNLSAPDTEAPDDRRFKNPLWQTNPFYSFVMKQYQINADALRRAAADLEIEDDVDRRRIEWFTRQMIDMLAPTNFLATNPDALEKAIETEGESLVRGLENLVRDVESGHGELVVSLSDRDAFRVGENIGTTPGEVVYRTDMLELIQFHPTTDKVHRTPIIVFPPWINKYYIMDLKPQNSLLRWIVDQGYTLFVVSWKNPDASHADLAMDDYVAAYLDVIGKALELTEEPQLNAVGYCIAGTTLSATLALMNQRGDDRVKSATFFTTLTDFSDQGEFMTFLQDDFVGGIEDEVERTGYLSAQLMQRTFSFLRANDLVWGPAIRSYMLGEAPPAFDLLYWNGDGTNLPGKMVKQYLRDLCQANALAEGGFEILGHKVHLSEVTLPLCAVACESDHIAPWLHSWTGVKQMGSRDKTFLLSESGHIAGIINPPTKVKYGHYTSDMGFDGTAQDWREGGTFHQGSWWGHWEEWLSGRSGEMIAARAPSVSLAPAPGTYVLEKA